MHPKVKALLPDKDKYAQRSEAWYRVRETLGVTGSDAAGILGLNPPCFTDSQPEAIMMKKLGLTEPFTGNEYTAWGQKYEDEAIERYCARYNREVELFGLLVHPVYSYIGASPDGISTCGVALEVKVRGGKSTGRSGSRGSTKPRWTCTHRSTRRICSKGRRGWG